MQYRRIIPNRYNRGKVRGCKRKFNLMKKRLLIITEKFPEPDEIYGYYPHQQIL